MFELIDGMVGLNVDNNPRFPMFREVLVNKASVAQIQASRPGIVMVGEICPGLEFTGHSFMVGWKKPHATAAILLIRSVELPLRIDFALLFNGL